MYIYCGVYVCVCCPLSLLCRIESFFLALCVSNSLFDVLQCVRRQTDRRYPTERSESSSMLIFETTHTTQTCRDNKVTTPRHASCTYSLLAEREQHARGEPQMISVYCWGLVCSRLCGWSQAQAVCVIVCVNCHYCCR